MRREGGIKKKKQSKSADSSGCVREERPDFPKTGGIKFVLSKRSEDVWIRS